jgi:hypothetical protein
MLSGAALHKKLTDCIHVFADTENLGELTILETLNKLIELYPIFPDPVRNTLGARVPDPPPEDYPNTVEKRLELLRRRLRNIIAAETSENKLLCDKAFQLQMILARGFPVNSDVDIITQYEFKKNSKLVFLSNGTVFIKSSAQDYFSRSISRSGNDYIDLNRESLSQRELASLTAQGIEGFSVYALKPSSLPEWGKYIGNILGTVITLALFLFVIFATGLFPPLLTFPMVVLAGFSLFASASLESSDMLRIYAPIAGITLIAALISLVFPPVLALIAATSLITSSTAAAVVTFVNTTGLGLIMPALMAGVALARHLRFPEISFNDALFKILNYPHVVIQTVCAKVGKGIGKGIQRIANYFNPPRDELLIPANNAVAVDIHSHAFINYALEIEITAASQQQLMPIQPTPAATAEKEPSQNIMEHDPLATLCNDAYSMMRHV